MEIKQMLGELAHEQLETLALEFTFGAFYPKPENPRYNVIDKFIKQAGDELSRKDHEYLIMLRDSYMSLFEV